MIKTKNILFFCFLMVGMACQQKQHSKKETHSIDQNSTEFKERLIQQNRQLISEEIELIDAYIERYGLKMDTTSTGLRYKIENRTTGKEVRLMNDVSISYSVSLLNGSLCYSSDSSGLLTFTIGQSNQPSGLQEGLLKLREGESAMFIIPSYLAYGVSGDGICVPGSSSLLFKVKLEKIVN